MREEAISKVLIALTPLIEKGIVTDVRVAGIADANSNPRPFVVVAVAGKIPRLHAAEISRLMYIAGLTDMLWAIDSQT